MGLADELMCRGETSTAQAALDSLAAMRQRLDDQGTGIDLAGQRLEQLVDLKNRTINQTRDLAQATESLELMADVHEQLGKIAASFGRMRHWIVEILAFEPAFTRAMRTLQPLTELNNLRRMNPTELRQVLRSLDNRSDTQWTGTDTGTLDSASSTAPVVEGALRTK
jgi:ABC-type transporter Mla subunit MlaD